MIAGPSAMVIGQPNLRMQMIGSLLDRGLSIGDFALIGVSPRQSNKLGSHQSVSAACLQSTRPSSAPWSDSAMGPALRSLAAQQPWRFHLLSIPIAAPLFRCASSWIVPPLSEFGALTPPPHKAQAYAKQAVKGLPVSQALTVGMASVSGAVIFGTMSLVLDTLDCNWC